MIWKLDVQLLFYYAYSYFKNIFELKYPCHSQEQSNIYVFSLTLWPSLSPKNVSLFYIPLSSTLLYFVQVAPGSLKILYNFILKMLIIALLIRKQQLKLDVEQQTGSK